jgi:hypothetical protein
VESGRAPATAVAGAIITVDWTVRNGRETGISESEFSPFFVAMVYV